MNGGGIMKDGRMERLDGWWERRKVRV
jgi:hypothetical protein